MSARHARFIILSTLLLGVAGAARVHDRLSASARDIRGATFADRVADYATLRGHVLEQLARSDPRADLSDAASRNALASALRNARQRSHSGEVFGNDDIERILHIVRADLSRRDPLDYEALLAEVPVTPPAQVNEFYPEGAPLATVPPLLLAQLPSLPPSLQYRFLGDALILLDVDTNLIVDFIPDALTRRT